MPDLKISQLPPASTPLAGTELVPIVQGGVTDQTTVQAILTGTVPSGTANGVLYLNGSKVVTSGSALTFDGTNLSVTANNANGLVINALSINAAARNWFVGANVNVFGDFTLQQSNAQGGDPVSAGRTLYTILADGSSVWYPSGSEQMRLTSTGLGIGTNNPGYKLDVNGAINVANNNYIRSGSNPLLASDGSTFNYIYTGTTALAWRNRADTTELMRLNSSGNLGLGVTPSAWGGAFAGALQVGRAVMHSNTGDFRASFGQNYYVDGTNARYIGDGFATQLLQVSGEYRFFNAPNNTSGAGAGPISFTQAMTLDASGNLLVGTTSTTIPTASGSLIYLNSPGALYVGHANGAASGTIYSAFAYNGSVIGSITQDGTTAVLYNTTSDQRLKENVQDADPASNLIDAIQVRQFDWKSDGSHQRYGMVAQELAQVAPEAVHQPADPEEMMAVDYSKLVPMLIKEIQSLRARVAAIEA